MKAFSISTFRFLLANCLLQLTYLPGAVDWPLKVSDNGRILTDSTGEPFFFLCDTAWQLAGKTLDSNVRQTHLWATSLEQMRLYIDDCAEKGFSVIHFALLNEFENKEVRKVTQPDAAFFERCRRYVDYALQRDIAVILIPAWMGFNGRHWAGVFEELEEEEIRAFARFVARQFRDYPNVLYSMGGDCAAYVEEDEEVVVDIREESRWMGETFKEEDPDALCLYFSQGNQPSSQFFHDSDWCDFNFVEVKRPESPRQYMDVVRDFHRTPAKPTLMGEFAYEYEFEGQRWPPIDAHIIRRSAYWNLLSGSLGYTYGRRGLWHFNHTAEELGLTYKLHKPWEELLTCEKSPGRCHMAIVSETFHSLSWDRLIPNHFLPEDRKLIAEGVDGLGTLEFVASAVADDGSLALAYFPSRLETVLNLQALRGQKLEAIWKDPSSDLTLPVRDIDLSDISRSITPPAEPNASGDSDWLLILEAIR